MLLVVTLTLLVRRVVTPLAVLLLAVTMIQSPLGALLVAEVGRARLTKAGLPAAGQTAIALPAVTVGAQKEYRPAFPGIAKPLP